MKPHKITAVLALALILLAAMPRNASSQNIVDADERLLAVDSITASWEAWTSVGISGKFRMAGLPLSPSVKIYMVRDSSIFISLRAPLVGEVGRAEIADSTLLVVNKINKTYVEEPIARALAYYPGGVSDLQDLILGRVVIPGFGLLSRELADKVEIYAEADGSSTLVATKESAIPGFNYGYMISPRWLTGALMVLPVDKPDVSVVLSYEYFEKGYDLDFVYQSDKRNYTARLELGRPEYDAKGFDRIKLNSGFTKLPFDKFIKSFK